MDVKRIAAELETAHVHPLYLRIIQFAAKSEDLSLAGRPKKSKNKKHTAMTASSNEVKKDDH